MIKEKRFDYKELPTTQFGLKFRPTIDEWADQQDWLEYGYFDGKLKSMQYLHSAITQEFSNENKKELINIMNELKSREQLNSILEIGVHRSGLQSSTKTILENKLPATKYFGVDLVEHQLSAVRNHADNIFCLCQNSSNTEIIINWVKTHDVNEFSLILIDGWHSISQVADFDFRFAKYLEKQGFITFHDINYHPVSCVFDSIDEDFFDKKRLCLGTQEQPDWGFGVACLIK